jgi:hypothetical protein
MPIAIEVGIRDHAAGKMIVLTICPHGSGMVGVQPAFATVVDEGAPSFVVATSGRPDSTACSVVPAAVTRIPTADGVYVAVEGLMVRVDDLDAVYEPSCPLS